MDKNYLLYNKGTQMTIQDMQEAIMADGWRFAELTFNDGSGDTFIEFSKNNYGYLGLGAGPKPDGNIGWGRFPRHEAWEKAYQYIIVDKKHLHDELVSFLKKLMRPLSIQEQPSVNFLKTLTKKEDITEE